MAMENLALDVRVVITLQRNDMVGVFINEWYRCSLFDIKLIMRASGKINVIVRSSMQHWNSTEEQGEIELVFEQTSTVLDLQFSDMSYWVA